jgi:periplasmic divalent cation tolerance protein
MLDSDSAVLIYTTFPSIEEAETAGRHLVESKLAACVNIFPSMVSIYEWEGKTERSVEAAMLIKTRKTLETTVLEKTKEVHPYETPALLVLDAERSHQEFFSWICQQTQ